HLGGNMSPNVLDRLMRLRPRNAGSRSRPTQTDPTQRERPASARPRALEPRSALDLVRVQPLGAYGLPPTASISRSSETPLLNSASPSRSKLIGSDRPRRTN